MASVEQGKSRSLVHTIRNIFNRKSRSSAHIDDVVLHGYADQADEPIHVSSQYRPSLDGRPRTADGFDQTRSTTRRNSMERLRTAVGSMLRQSYIEQDLRENDGIKYDTIGGRKYISGIPYILPSDKDEQLRMDALHFYLKVLLRDNTVIPLSKKHAYNILDCGHGSGIWVMEMARAYPTACIVGVDVAATELPYDVIPHNVNFQRVDILEGLPYMSNSFDMVHERLLGLGTPADKWEAMLKEQYRVLKPGGLIQVDEFDLVFHNDGPISQDVAKMIGAICEKRGLDLGMAARLEKVLRSVGFVEVEVRTVQMRYDEKAGALGERFFWNMHDMVQSMVPLAMELEYEEAQEVDRRLSDWKSECAEKETYQNVFVYTAKRPIEAEKPASEPVVAA